LTLRQCVILAGGLGTRLGDLTRETPKPLLEVAGRPFLEHLLAKAAGHGLDRALLLVGHNAGAVDTWLAERRPAERYGLEIALSVEPEPLGTGGALALARPALDDAFLLMNGDTWFAFDWSDLARADVADAVLALREVAPADRYETVDLDPQGRVTRFAPRDPALVRGLINGGVYRLRRSAVPEAVAPVSLERDVLPALSREGRAHGRVYDGAFIDIGVPDSFAAAQDLLAAG